MIYFFSNSIFIQSVGTVNRFFDLFEKYGGNPENNVKLKKPKQLQEVLDIARFLLFEAKHGDREREFEEKRGKLDQLRSVLEM